MYVYRLTFNVWPFNCI